MNIRCLWLMHVSSYLVTSFNGSCSIMHQLHWDKNLQKQIKFQVFLSLIIKFSFKIWALFAAAVYTSHLIKPTVKDIILYNGPPVVVFLASARCCHWFGQQKKLASKISYKAISQKLLNLHSLQVIVHLMLSNRQVCLKLFFINIYNRKTVFFFFFDETKTELDDWRCRAIREQ